MQIFNLFRINVINGINVIFFFLTFFDITVFKLFTTFFLSIYGSLYGLVLSISGNTFFSFVPILYVLISYVSIYIVISGF